MHPSNGSESLNIGQTLTRSSNYRPWRRSTKIALSIKHKLVSLLGMLAKPMDVAINVVQREACNNLVMS